MELKYRDPRTALVAWGQIDHHVADMTATFAADVSLAAAQDALAAHGQWLAVDGDPSGSLGDLVAGNSTGPLRLGYGAWRDLLLGVQFRNHADELISAGGRAMKNVAGYDLTKLMIGQRGAFGEIVTITVRTYRRPVGAVLARFASDARILPRLLPTPARPQWAMLTSDALFCGYLGDEQTLAFYTRDLEEHRPHDLAPRPLSDDLTQRRTMWRTPAEQASFRASVPPTRVLEFAKAISPRAWVADAAFGIVLGSYEGAEDAALIKQSADAAGGSVTLFDPTGLITDSPATPAAQQLIARLVAAFDRK